MKIAIEGCCHGEMDKIYEILGRVEEEKGYKIDLLICCGDFQSVRNSEDLNCMAVPMKYRYMQSFYKYYSGEKKAPIFTIFIGGNHEASNYLWELSYGGWVAPNIFYMGNAGVVKYGGLRIAGLSGIYKPFDYEKNHFECPPYSPNTVRSAYHVRSCDVFRLRQISGNIDIGLSHDWPLGIHDYGDRDLLVRLKPFFNEEMSNNTLGSPPAMDLLKHLQPAYWFSGHLHVKFSAVYRHKNHRSMEQTQQATGAEEAPSGEEAMESQSEGQKKEEELLGGKEESGAAVEQARTEEVQDSQDAGKESVETEKEGDEAQDSNEAGKESAGVDKGSSEGEEETLPSENKTVEEQGQEDNSDTAASGDQTAEAEGAASEVVKDAPADDNMNTGSAAQGEKAEDTSTSVNTASLCKYTKFLALDKVMPRKRFLQILDLDPCDDVKPEPPFRLEYDAEWLAILKSTEPLMKYKEEPMWTSPKADTDERTSFTPTEEELLDIQQRFSEEGSDSHLYIPENFTVTVPAHVDSEQVDYKAVPKARENPQSVQFCEKLGIDNPFHPTVFGVPETAPPNPEEIHVDVDEEEHHSHDDAEENEGTNAASRPSLVLPPPSNTQCADPAQSGSTDSGTSNITATGTGVVSEEPADTNDEAKQENGESCHTDPEDDQADGSKCQSLKRSLSDRSPDRLKPLEESATAEAAEDESATTESEVSNKLEEEPLIKRRNLDMYKEDSAEVVDE